MTEVTRQQAITIRQDIETALADVLAKHGMVLGKVSTSYGERFSMRLEAHVPSMDESGVDLNSKYAATFRREALLCRIQGFPSNEAVDMALGATITMQGEEWVFLGYNTQAWRNPMLFRRVKDGRTYKFREAGVTRLLPGFTTGA